MSTIIRTKAAGNKGTAEGDNKKNSTLSLYGIKVLKIAAFCFALVSWFATAQGLTEYVFTRHRLQAWLISFAIQSVLFVFNLRLPEYFIHIGNNVPDSRKNKRKYLFKGTYKWTVAQKIIAFFYGITIIASSFFSFVYMTNIIYKNTQYIDANIVLERNLRENIVSAEHYINEDSKMIILLAGEYLTDLAEISKEVENPSEKTKEGLEQAVNTAADNYKSKETELENAKEELKVYEKKASDLFDNRFGQPEAYEEACQDVIAAQRTVNSKKSELTAAKNALDAAKKELEDFKPPISTIIHDMLTEIMKPSPVKKTLNNKMTELINSVVYVHDNGTLPENFQDITIKTKQLSLLIEQYSSLVTVYNDPDNSDNLINFKNKYIAEKVTIPDPESDNFEKNKEKWESTWKSRYKLLSQIISAIPEYSSSEYENTYKGVINVNLLKNFNCNKTAKMLDSISRSNLYNINILERSFRHLFGSYSFLAWFAFILSIFLDVSSLLVGLFIYFTDKKRIY